MGLSAAERQRAYQQRKRAERAALPKVPCACGCGTLIPPINTQGKPARFAHGHNQDGLATRFRPGQPGWNKGRSSPWVTAAKKGRALPSEQVARRTATRRAKNGGGYQTARGWKHSPETLARVTAANRRNIRLGAANHAWEEGKSFRPYDESFNRDVKMAVLLRDRWRCRDCGARLGRDRKSGRKPNVHHIDLSKLNSAPINLVSLCVPCHQRRHWDARKSDTAGG